MFDVSLKIGTGLVTTAAAAYSSYEGIKKVRQGDFGLRLQHLFTTRAYAATKGWSSEVHICIECGDLKGLRAALEKYPTDINKYDGVWTPLAHAANCQNPEMVKFLVEKGADLDGCNKRSFNTPLHVAFRKNNIPIITYLLSKGANMNVCNGEGNFPLQLANLSTAKKFLKDLNFFDWDDGALPLHKLILSSPSLAEASLSRSYGINVPCSRYNNASPLHLAVGEGRINLVGSLLSRGAQIDAQDNDGNTPLHIALERGHDQIVKKLLGYGARVDIRNHSGLTPLAYAFKKGQYVLARKLEDKEYSRKSTPWYLTSLPERQEDGRFVRDGKNFLRRAFSIENKTKDLYEAESSPWKLKAKAVVALAIAPLYLPLSVIRQIGALALDIAKVAIEIFRNFRLSNCMNALVITPVKQLIGSLAKRVWHVATSPLFCVGLMFAGLYTQYDANEGRKWMSRMAESWDESRLLRPFSLAKVGNRNMTLINGNRRFQA